MVGIIFLIHEFPLLLQCPGYILCGPQQQRHGKQPKMFHCQAKVIDKNQVDRTHKTEKHTTRPGLYGAADDGQREPGVARLQVRSGGRCVCGGEGGGGPGWPRLLPSTELRGKIKKKAKTNHKPNRHRGTVASLIIITTIFPSFSPLRRRN